MKSTRNSYKTLWKSSQILEEMGHLFFVYRSAVRCWHEILVNLPDANFHVEVQTREGTKVRKPLATKIIFKK